MSELRSGFGLPGADDPAYAHELDSLARACRDFVGAFDRGDFDGCLLLTGMVTAQCAAVYKLSPEAGVFDPRTLFDRPESPDGR